MLNLTSGKLDGAKGEVRRTTSMYRLYRELLQKAPPTKKGIKNMKRKNGDIQGCVKDRASLKENDDEIREASRENHLSL